MADAAEEDDGTAEAAVVGQLLISCELVAAVAEEEGRGRAAWTCPPTP